MAQDEKDKDRQSLQEAYNAYESLSQGEIRILTLLPGRDDDSIQCETRMISLGSGPVYEAISYAWGSTSGLVHIQFNGTSRLTRHNLADCLRHLRYEDTPRVLWVDALCMAFSSPTSCIAVMHDLLNNGLAHSEGTRCVEVSRPRRSVLG
jgi:hypothetical protein